MNSPLNKSETWNNVCKKSWPKESSLHEVVTVDWCEDAQVYCTVSVHGEAVQCVHQQVLQSRNLGRLSAHAHCHAATPRFRLLALVTKHIWNYGRNCILNFPGRPKYIKQPNIQDRCAKEIALIFKQTVFKYIYTSTSGTDSSANRPERLERVSRMNIVAPASTGKIKPALCGDT